MRPDATSTDWATSTGASTGATVGSGGDGDDNSRNSGGIAVSPDGNSA